MRENPPDGGPTSEAGWDDSNGAAAAQGSRLRLLLYLVMLAAVLCVLLHESLIGGKGLVAADGILDGPPWNQPKAPSSFLLRDQSGTFIPQHEFVHQQVLRGHFPLWDPYLDCGKPNLGAIQGALLFPVNLLLMPLDPFYSSGLAAFLKLFLAGWFTMLYLRLLGISDSAAFFSGLVFSLSGFMIVWLGHPQINCAMWLPLLLYFIEKSFRVASGPAANLFSRPNLRTWIGFAVAYASMLLGGHPPTAVHVTILTGIYFVFRLVSRRGGRPFLVPALFLGALTAGILLAAAQILPYLEYYNESSSSSSSAMIQRWSISLEPNTALGYLFPHLFGSPVDGLRHGKLFGTGRLL